MKNFQYETMKHKCETLIINNMERNMRKATSYEQEIKILKDIEMMMKYEDISAKYGISKSTISRIKSKHNPELQKSRLLEKQIKELSGKQKIAITKSIIKNGELVFENMLSTLNIIIYGVEKLYNIAERAEDRLDKMQTGLEKLLKDVNKNITFPIDNKGKQKEKDDLIKKIYTVLGQITQFYAVNKILIDAVNGLKGHAETYTKLNLEANAIHGLIEFFNTLFEGLNLLNDEQYEKYRDFIISNSELGKQLFSTFDKEVENPSTSYHPQSRKR